MKMTNRVVFWDAYYTLLHMTSNFKTMKAETILTTTLCIESKPSSKLSLELMKRYRASSAKITKQFPPVSKLQNLIRI